MPMLSQHCQSTLNQTGRTLFRLAAVAGVCIGVPSSASAKDAAVKVGFGHSEQLVPQLALTLDYFQDEGIQVVPVKVEDFVDNDFMFQQLMVERKIDVMHQWLHHAYFGARHGFPIEGVMMLNDAPGITVFVTN